MKGEKLEVTTKLVNYSKSRLYLQLMWTFAAMAIFACLLAGRQTNGLLGTMDNNYIQQNLQSLLQLATVAIFMRFLLAGFAGSKVTHFENLGYLKMNADRANVNGVIFNWSDISALRFNINSPKVFGERSAKNGFRNWIEFTASGSLHRHEFYLETQKMEDTLLELIQEIRAADGAPKLTITVPAPKGKIHK